MRKQLGAAASGATDAATKGLIDALIGAGATDIGAALADGDILPIYDLSATANRGTALSRVATWLFAKVGSHVTMTSGGVATISEGVITNAMLSTAGGGPGGSYTSYTPTFAASPTNPVLGTGGSTTGTYVKFGKLCLARGSVQFGTSGASVGSGTYTFGLPFPNRAATQATALTVGVIRCSGLTTNARASFNEAIIFDGESVMQFRYASAWPAGADARVGATAPSSPTINNATLANNGRYEFAVLYETA